MIFKYDECKDINSEIRILELLETRALDFKQTIIIAPRDTIKKLKEILSDKEYEKYKKYGYLTAFYILKDEYSYGNGLLTEITKEEAIEQSIDFNSAQYEFLYENKKNILVNALAGTGKTRSIINHATNLILYGECSLDEIVIITFTKAAAKEIRSRLNKALKQYLKIKFNQKIFDALMNINMIKISTIDSYFHELFDESSYILGYGKNSLKINFNDTIKKIINDVVYRKINTSSSDIQDYLKVNEIYPSDYIDFFTNLMDEDTIDMYNLELYKIYEDTSKDNEFIKLAQEMLLDIASDIKNEIKKLSRESNSIPFRCVDSVLLDILENYQCKIKSIEKMKYFIVDESQDTSSNQWKVIRNIMNLNNKCTYYFVGDKYQSIYGFRGADLDVINSIKEAVENNEKTFTYNFRSTQEVLEQVNVEMKKQFSDFPGISVPSSANNGFANIYPNNGNASMKKNLISKLVASSVLNLREAKKNGVNLDSNSMKVAVLVRRNCEAEEIASMLRENSAIKDKKITIMVNNGGSLFQSQAAKDLICLMEFMLDENNYANKLKMINSDFIVFENTNGKEIEKNSLKSYSEESINILSKDIGNKIKSLIDFKLSNIENLIKIVSKLKNRNSIYSNYFKDIYKILELVRKQTSTDTLIDMVEFLKNQFKSNKTEKSFDEEEGNSEVLITTEHATKGLAYFSVVLVADGPLLKNNRVGSSKRVNTDFIIQGNQIAFAMKRIYNTGSNIDIQNSYYDLQTIEKQNNKEMLGELYLVYVAMTRAIQDLYIIANIASDKNIGSMFKEK